MCIYFTLYFSTAFKEILSNVHLFFFKREPGHLSYAKWEKNRCHGCFLMVEYCIGCLLPLADALVTCWTLVLKLQRIRNSLETVKVPWALLCSIPLLSQQVVSWLGRQLWEMRVIFFLMSQLPLARKWGYKKKRGQEKRQQKSPVVIAGYFLAVSCKTATPQFLMR